MILQRTKGEGSLTEGLCFNVMIGVTIMVVILAIGSAMLWTAQRLMNVSQVSHQMRIKGRPNPFKLGPFLVVVQLICRPTKTKISYTII